METDDLDELMKILENSSIELDSPKLEPEIKKELVQTKPPETETKTKIKDLDRSLDLTDFKIKKSEPEPEPEPIKFNTVVERSKPAEIQDNNQSTSDIKEMLHKYREVFEGVIDNCSKDRNQAQQVIDHFFDVVQNSGKVPSVYIEKFPELLKTKNDIALTAIRAMDSLSKLISASKGDSVINNNVSIDVGLSQILDELDTE